MISNQVALAKLSFGVLVCAVSLAAVGASVASSSIHLPAAPGDLDWRSSAMLDEVEAPGCYANEVDTTPLPGQLYPDDSIRVDLPFEINHYGYVTSSGWITLDGSYYLDTPDAQVYDGDNGRPSSGMNLNDILRWDNVFAPMLANNSLYYSSSIPDDAGNDRLTYGEITYEGHQAFCVTWQDIGYGNTYLRPGALDEYGSGPIPWFEYQDPTNYIYWTAYDKTDSFQLVLVEREDVGNGAYDIEFNYGSIQIDYYDQFRGNPDGIPSQAYDEENDWSAGWSANNIESWCGDSVCYLTREQLTEYREAMASSPEFAATILPPVHWSFWDNPARSQWLDGHEDENGHATGLARTSTKNGDGWGIGLPGRHLWEVRPDDPDVDLSDRYAIPGKVINDPDPDDDTRPVDLSSYVALGDSFSSGEGTGFYFDGTNYYANLCHRSITAYPALLNRRAGFPVANFEFWACTNTWANDMGRSTVSTTRAPWNDPLKDKWNEDSTSRESGQGINQFDRLTTDTRIVTLTIGGNDTRWIEFIGHCIGINLMDGTSRFFNYEPCEYYQKQPLEAQIDSLWNEDLWVKQIEEIKERAPDATVLLIGYPLLFSDWGGGNDTIPWNSGCYWLSKADQMFYNKMATRLNNHIREQAVESGALYIDVSNAMNSDEVCTEGNSAEWAINGASAQLLDAGAEFKAINIIDLLTNHNLMTMMNPLAEENESHGINWQAAFAGSFHPNDLGHEKLSSAIIDQYREPAWGQRGPLSFDGSVLTFTHSFPTTLKVHLNWNLTRIGNLLDSTTPLFMSAKKAPSAAPQGVLAVITSPSGVVYTRYNLDGSFGYEGTESSEDFKFENAEVGEWLVELYLSDPALEGNEYLLQYYAEPPVNAAPVPQLSLTRTGNSIDVSGEGSTDSDGSIIQYFWDFGDGGDGFGTTAHHEYTTEGTFLVSLVAIDNLGEMGFAYSDHLTVDFPDTPAVGHLSNGWFAPFDYQPSIFPTLPSTEPSTEQYPRSVDDDVSPPTAADSATPDEPSSSSPLLLWLAGATLFLSALAAFVRLVTRRTH